MKKAIAIVACLVVALAATYLSWRRYDPTVPWHVSDERMIELLYRASPDARVVEKRSEPFAPHKISWLIRYHPQYREPPRLVVSGFPDSSASFLADTPGGRLRCYSHYFRGRTAAFTIATTNENPIAERLAGELKTAFPCLPIHQVTSESGTTEDPTSP